MNPLPSAPHLVSSERFPPKKGSVPSVRAAMRHFLVRPSDFLYLWVVSLFLLPASLWASQQQNPATMLRARAHDAAGSPVADVLVQLLLRGEVVASARTDEKGEAEPPKVAPGTYQVAASKDRYETSKQSEVVVTSDVPIELEFTLVPKLERKESVTVEATPDNPVEQGSSVPTEVQHKQIQNLPNKPASVAEVLPM